tara:strand:+ start:13283 stop:14194 length:912 start_codon:yes stop_codon:yes gene_type:complete
MSFDDSHGTEPLLALEKKQQLLAHHVRLLARKMTAGLFVFGAQGGLGKSRVILSTLEECGIEPVLINSHITPLALFATLWTHRDDAVIFFDDVDSMFSSSSMAHLGLLRSALWGNPRIVTYGSSQLADLPSSFEFTSRCVFACNVIPKSNNAFDAVLTRCDQFELSATNGEVIEMMRHLSRNGFDQLSVEDCETVIDYIEQESEDRQLSLRLLGSSLRKFRYARDVGIDFRPLLKSQLSSLGRKQIATKRLDNKSADLKALRDAIKRHPESTADQQQHWCKATGKSRASYFRVRKRLEAEAEA